jgi:hypothetical protein
MLLSKVHLDEKSIQIILEENMITFLLSLQIQDTVLIALFKIKSLRSKAFHVLQNFRKNKSKAKKIASAISNS